MVALKIPGIISTLWRRDALGFTLLELLVVLAIVGLLTALVFAGVRQAGQAANRASSISVLRQYGLALHSYATEHQSFPGPLWVGQEPFYTARDRQLVTHLWPLFQETEPAYGSTPEWMVTRQYRQWLERQPSQAGKWAYGLPQDAVTRDGQTLKIWGYPDGEEESAQANWLRLMTEANQTTTVIMYEAVGTSRDPNRAPRPNELQNYGASLMLDGHVELTPY